MSTVNSCKTSIFIFLLISNACISSFAMTHEKNQLSTSDFSSPLYPKKIQFQWLEQQQITNHAYDALDFIAASRQHGLSPNKYNYSELNNLDPTLDLQTAQRFEKLLTEGLLTLINDMTTGQFKAKDADPDWFIPQKKFNATAFLQQALLKKYFKTELNSLLPDTTKYRALIQELARYQSYRDRGAWTTIPSMPLMHSGKRHPSIAAVRTRLSFEYPELTLSSPKNTTLYDPILEQAVRLFQKKYGLKVDGVIGTNTRNEMNISAKERVQQIQVTLERHRWMPSNLGQRYLIINLANYTLSAIEDGDEKLDMRVIVGRKSRPTPSFTADMNHLVFNPFWNVPRKLAKLDLLPKQQADLNYFYTHDIRVFTHNQSEKIEHDAYSIDWKSVSPRHFPYTFRQDPGEHNALGKLKFMFKNQWGIYLHDTSHRELFTETKRSLSSGCIRVEDPIALANFSLDNNPKTSVIDIIESKKNTGLKLKKKLPIYAVYFTVSVDKNEVIFSPDIYQRDRRIAELL